MGENEKKIQLWARDAINHFDEICSQKQGISQEAAAILAGSAAICNQLENWGNKLEFQLEEMSRMIGPSESVTDEGDTWQKAGS